MHGIVAYAPNRDVRRWSIEMHISHKHRFVYIGIPRTGSRSMFQWLSDNYQSENLGGHHDCNVPEEFSDYLVFTVVRNPYDRMVSGWFYEPTLKYPHDPPKSKTFADSMRRHLAADPQDTGMWTQKRFVEQADISLVLHFERRPQCLAELPFVDAGNIPPFPHWNASDRPPGRNFFDLFSKEDEKLVWEHSAEDFASFGYERFKCGLAKSSNKTSGGDVQ